MLPGPVFARELLTTARRGRYYAMRSLYGLVLLAILWGNYGILGRADAVLEPEAIRENLGRFTEAFVHQFAIAQELVVLAMTPALVAGAVADEKQRKTLHYLLTSRLTGGEIVLGKLMARLLHVGVVLAIGPPVIAMLSTLGGVDPVFVAQAYAAAIATAFFVGALSILASTLARSAREAIFLAYALEVAWLALPAVYAEAPAGTWPEALDWLGRLNGWIYASSPVGLSPAVMYGIGNPFAAAALGTRVAGMAGLQLAYGSLALLLAVVVLRRAYARHGGAGKLTVWTAPRRWRLLARPACGDDPMAWKERHVAPPGRVARLVAGPVAVALASVLGFLLIDEARPAFRMARAQGYGPEPGFERYLAELPRLSPENPQQQLNGFVRAGTGLLYGLYVVGLAVAAAGSVTTEREEDTWISLVATPLDGREILRAKMLGAAWRCRGLAVLMLALWAVGVAGGAVHPLALLLAPAMLAVLTWFYAALGAWASLRSTTTTRALLLTMGGAFVFSGGLMILPRPPILRTPVSTEGYTLSLLNRALLSYRDVEILTQPRYLGGPAIVPPGGFFPDVYSRLYYSPFAGPGGTELVAVCLMGPLLYLVAAAWLTRAARRAFDRVVDRPRRPSGEHLTPPRPAGH